MACASASSVRAGFLQGWLLMDGVPAIYKGKLVSKENFRVYVYSTDGTKKLVESWNEFESHMETGIWFARRKDAFLSKVEEEKTRARTKRVKKNAVDKEPLEDDFLPKVSE